MLLVLSRPALAELTPGELSRPRASSGPGEAELVPTDGAEESPPAHRLSDATELERLTELYMAGEYERCTAELTARLDPAADGRFTEPSVIERGRLYLASCALLAGSREPARAALRAALEENPLMSSPDSLTFPPPVVSLFLEVRDEVQQLVARREQEQLTELTRKAAEAEARAAARRAEEEELRRLASEEQVIVRSSRWIASLPLGAGQFQSGREGLGAFFLASEVVLLGTVVASAAILSDVSNQQTTATAADYTAARDAAYATLVASSWTLAGVTAIGIAEAHLSFKTERVVERRVRPLPAHLTGEDEDPTREAPGLAPSEPRSLSLVPTLLPTRGGLSLGLSGSF